VGQPTKGANGSPAYWPNGHGGRGRYEIRVREMRCAAKRCKNNDPQEIAHLIVKPCAARGARMYCYEIRTDHPSGSRLPERAE
jgi:hypothetical protein